MSRALNGWALRSFLHPRRWLSMESAISHGALAREYKAASPALAKFAQQPTLRVGGVPEHFNAPWHTAAAKGLFDAAGLRIEWTDFPGGTGAMTQALRDDEIDVALALTEGLVADLHRGNPSKLLATYVSTPLTWGVHVPARSALRTMDDVGAGAKYAVSRLGSGSHLMACVDAHARGLDPRTLEMAPVGSLDGARAALRDGQAEVFLWEKYTTKFLVDAGEWRRVGEVPTPWPSFSVAATDACLARAGELLLTMLGVVRAEAAGLRASADVASTIGLMYGQHEEDITEWLDGVRWSAQPVVSHATLSHVMSALVDAGVLEADELMPPSALLSHFTADGDANADAI